MLTVAIPYERMMQRLFILGCGGFGREIAALLPDHPDFSKAWNFCGFLDRRTDWEKTPAKYPILGNEDEFDFRADDLMIIAIANGKIKERLYQKLQNKVQFFTFIHPSVKLLDFASIGMGSVIYPNCIVSTAVSIGKFCTLNLGTQVGHDCQIGDFCSLMASVDLGGETVLGNHVFMGTKSMVVPRKSIADDVNIAAGSVVMRSIKTPGCTVMGNPAVKFD